DNNYGSTTYLTAYDRFIMQFNLPAELINKTIVSAELSVYVWAVDSTDVGTGLLLYPVTRAWDEGSVTWNQAKSGTSWNTAGGDIGPAIGQLAVEDIDHQFLTPLNIPDLVQQWVDGSTPNYGLILDKGSDVGMGIKASEYGQHASPYLTITYSAKLCTDLDMDGDVDGADLAQLIGVFNPTCVLDFALAFGQ
ncbi:MAG: DNRLRE domain-containing protein, partial [Desulfobacterales bacterium]|nr:DNRLRE domain-containing protein [Desulfobacterales bacterium]